MNSHESEPDLTGMTFHEIAAKYGEEAAIRRRDRSPIRTRSRLTPEWFKRGPPGQPRSCPIWWRGYRALPARLRETDVRRPRRKSPVTMRKHRQAPLRRLGLGPRPHPFDKLRTGSNLPPQGEGILSNERPWAGPDRDDLPRDSRQVWGGGCDQRRDRSRPRVGPGRDGHVRRPPRDRSHARPGGELQALPPPAGEQAGRPRRTGISPHPFDKLRGRDSEIVSRQ